MKIKRKKKIVVKISNVDNFLVLHFIFHKMNLKCKNKKLLAN